MPEATTPNAGRWKHQASLSSIRPRRSPRPWPRASTPALSAAKWPPASKETPRDRRKYASSAPVGNRSHPGTWHLAFGGRRRDRLCYGALRGARHPNPEHGDRAGRRHRAQSAGGAAIGAAGYEFLRENIAALGGGAARLAGCAW